MGLNVRRGVLVWSFISVLGMNMASSEPMMAAHIEEAGLSERLVRFARCCSVDRT